MKEMRSIKIFLRLLSRYILGATFVFSGFVKAVDPLGFSYKLQDYFTAFGMQWFSGAALLLAVILSWVELMLGVLMLLDELRGVAVWGIAGFMMLFTPLTLYLALTNPVSDCGCFGDAVKLTNWETFGKNVILSIFAAILLVGDWKKRICIAGRRRWLQVACWVLLGGLAMVPSAYALRHLPVMDFRPYRVGASFAEGRVVPEGAAEDEYSTTFIYEKDGVAKRFTEEDYPWDDTTWTFVESETKQISKGYEPPMKNFALLDARGEDVTDSLLLGEAYTLLGVVPFLEKVSERDVERWVQLCGLMERRGGKAVIATSSGSAAASAFSARNGVLQFVTADERVLKTVVRADFGVVLVQRGVVLDKWRLRDVPIDGLSSGDLLGRSLQSVMGQRDALLVWLIVSALLLVRVALYGYCRRRAGADECAEEEGFIR